MDTYDQPNREKDLKVTIRREELGMLMKMFDAPVFTKSAEGTYLACSQSFCDLFGVECPEDGSVSPSVIYDRATYQYIRKRDKELLRDGKSQEFILNLPHKDGNLHRLLVTRFLVEEDGRPLRIYGRIKDLTDQERKKKEMDKLILMRDAVLEVNNASLYSDSLDDLLALILDKVLSMVDNAEIGTVLFKNEKGNFIIRASCGYNKDRIGEFDLAPEETFLWRHTKGKIYRAEIMHLTPEENFNTPPLEEEEAPFLIESSISAPIFIEGELYGLINVDSELPGVFLEEDREVLEFMRAQVEGVINRRRLFEHSKKISRTDLLTGIDNRYAFEYKLNQAISQGAPFYLVMFDLDRMKAINDTYGHEVGDRALKLVAAQLDQLKRDSNDVVARFGGDEFIGIFYREERKMLLEELEMADQDFQGRRLNVEGKDLHMTFSYGLVAFPQEGRKAVELIVEVDSRMYKYKRKLRRGRPSE